MIELAALPLLQVTADLWFVVRILVFSYLLFQLYLMFRDSQIIFGMAVIVSAYFIFVHAVSVTILMLCFFLFVVFGNQLQMLVMFGLEPLLGVFGIGSGRFHLEQNEFMRLEQKVAQGETLGASEMNFMQQYSAKQMRAQQMTGQMQEQQMRRRMG
ncbi:hypothetical protein H0O03_04060 [Candidatus Micrarchaeota archaeon]|nr:hypothetical protein [Candidatus Micrarchaeota archaeon]